MNTACRTAPAGPTPVASANRYDATTFGRTVSMTNREDRGLRTILATVHDCRMIVDASFEPAVPGYSFADVIGHLRAFLGAPFADAALAAASAPPRPRSRPPSP